MEKGMAGPALQSRTVGKTMAGAPLGEQLSFVTCFVCAVGQVGTGESSWCGSCSGRCSFALFIPPVSLGAAVSAACFWVGWQQRCGRKDRRGGGGNGFRAIFCSQQNTFVEKGKEISQSRKLTGISSAPLCSTCSTIWKVLRASADSTNLPFYSTFQHWLLKYLKNSSILMLLHAKIRSGH